MSLTAHNAARPAAYLSDAGRVLVVGVGGLGSPALRVLVQSGVQRFTLVDDDKVDETNLQRQILFGATDIGRPKVDAARDQLLKLAPSPDALDIQVAVTRFAPDNALSLTESHQLILEGADNYATKFLAADAAKLSNVAIVHAGAVRLSGWALASLTGEGACLRCIFEDIPRGQAETCAVAGVLGPVVGVLGALEASLAIQLLLGKSDAASQLWSYEALSGKLRKRRVQRRATCPLCTGTISSLDEERYLSNCAA